MIPLVGLPGDVKEMEKGWGVMSISSRYHHNLRFTVQGKHLFFRRQSTPMEFFETVKSRKSVRAYDDRPVPDDVLAKILESARLSPSAKNLQPWHFIVVRDPAKRAALSEGTWAKFLKDTPVVIVGCGDGKASPHWNTIDTSIALQTLVLAATAEGLGTCWVGSFDVEKVKALLKIPENYDVICLIALGYERKKMDLARTLTGGAKRKAIKTIVSYDEFDRQG
ncbi:MAG: nitroreductase family protein [Candidatus Thermoplasmatota archaeon]|nr:nitroreductase family protein [Candidatus Thermoplasmatota archaeon]